MKCSPVRAELLHTVRRTDEHDAAESRFSQFFESAWNGIKGGRINLYVCVEDEFIWISVPVIYVRKINSLYYVTPNAYRVCVCVCVYMDKKIAYDI